MQVGLGARGAQSPRMTRTDPPLPLVFTRRQALRAGLTSHQVQHRVCSGCWRRLRPGCYCLATSWARASRSRRHLILTAAAVLAIGPDRWASHASAAVVHGLPLPFAEVPVHLTHLPGSSTRYLRGLELMAAPLPVRQRTRGRGLPVTTEDRCVADCLRHLDAVDGVAIADAALHRRPHLRADVAAILEATTGWPFAAHGRTSWAMVDGRRESPAESWSYVAMARRQLPQPEPQARIYDERRRFVARVDAWWDDVAVVGEVDGRVKYGIGTDLDPEAARLALENEKIREDALRRLGAHVIRWGTRDLRDERTWARSVREELTRGDRGRFRGTVRRSPFV